MNDQAIQYLALDVHQATLAATLRDSSGAIVMRSTVRTNAKAIVTLARSAGARVHVAFDEGTQAQWLYDLLQPQVGRVLVCSVRGRDDGRVGCSADLAAPSSGQEVFDVFICSANVGDDPLTSDCQSLCGRQNQLEADRFMRTER